MLTDLCARAGAVAVISGRPEAFIREVLDVPKLEVVGLYGLSAHPPLDDDVRSGLAAVAGAEPGVELEDKRVSIALHARRAPEPEAALDRMRPAVRALAVEHGLTSFEGKLVLEVSPPGARKGGAVQQLLDRLASTGCALRGRRPGGPGGVRRAAGARHRDLPGRGGRLRDARAPRRGR